MSHEFLGCGSLFGPEVSYGMCLCATYVGSLELRSTIEYSPLGNYTPITTFNQGHVLVRRSCASFSAIIFAMNFLHFVPSGSPAHAEDGLGENHRN